MTLTRDEKLKQIDEAISLCLTLAQRQLTAVEERYSVTETTLKTALLDIYAALVNLPGLAQLEDPKPVEPPPIPHKINAIKVVRNVKLTDGVWYPSSVIPRAVNKCESLGLRHSKEIVDALDAAGMLKVRQ